MTKKTDWAVVGLRLKDWKQLAQASLPHGMSIVVTLETYWDVEYHVALSFNASSDSDNGFVYAGGRAVTPDTALELAKKDFVEKWKAQFASKPLPGQPQTKARGTRALAQGGTKHAS